MPDDLEQLLLRVVDVRLRQELHELLGSRERQRDRERAAVGRSEHDQAPAPPAAARVVHRLPRLGEELDEPAGDEPAHRVRDEMHGLPGAERLDLTVESRGALVDVLAPVERERPHVPARVELHEQRHVRLAMDAGRTDVDARVSGLPVGAELQISDPPCDQAQEVDPDAIRVALPVHGVELRTHDPREDEDLAELSPPAPASGRGARTGERLGPHLLLEQALVLVVERDEDAANGVEIGAVERRLELLEPRRLGPAHELVSESRMSSGHRATPAACDPCAAASALGGKPTKDPLLSVLLLGHIPLPPPVVKRATLGSGIGVTPATTRRRRADRTPNRARGSSPRGSSSGFRRSSRAGSRAG